LHTAAKIKIYFGEADSGVLQKVLQDYSITVLTWKTVLQSVLQYFFTKYCYCYCNTL